MGGGGGGEGGVPVGTKYSPPRATSHQKRQKRASLFFSLIAQFVIRRATLESIWPLCRIYKHLFPVRTVDAFVPAFGTFNLNRSQKGFQAISIPFEPLTSAAGRHASRTRLLSSSLCATWVIPPPWESS